MNIAIIGDGGWGTALGLLLSRGGHAVRMWSHEADYAKEMKATRKNPRFLQGVDLPADWQHTADPAEAVRGVDAAVLAVPSGFFLSALEKFRGLLPANARVVSVAKGLDPKTHRRLTLVAQEALGHKPVAALSGPSIADEVARGVPTAVTIACDDHAIAVELQRLFNGPTFRIYTGDDVIGVEIGGALKNVIAIAAGISDGLGYGDNTKAALVTRGLAEIMRVGVAVGGRRETFAGLSGVGDLIVTCSSKLSRNRGLGERIGRGEKARDILAGMRQVAEGAWTCRAALDLSKDLGTSLPITEQVFAVVHQDKDPRTAVLELMARDPKPEGR